LIIHIHNLRRRYDLSPGSWIATETVAKASGQHNDQDKHWAREHSATLRDILEISQGRDINGNIHPDRIAQLNQEGILERLRNTWTRYLKNQRSL
jgi:hypothetical protein